MTINYLSQKNYIPEKYLKKKTKQKLNKKVSKIISQTKDSINTSNRTLSVLNSKFKVNFKIQDLKKFKKFKNIAIIGMGGSILGSDAIYNFMKKKIKKNVYFFNDLDGEKILNFKNNFASRSILFIVISKSGNTIETLSNFFSMKIIKKNAKNIIIISEKKDNALTKLAKTFNLFYIEHKDYIGGRFSVLSEVGLIPAYLMGLNIFKLRNNLDKYITKKEKFLRDSALKLANLIYQKKFTNLIFINYFPKLEKFLYWSQQLIAESLGKNGKGFLPVISNTPKDHHSLLQLYIDGPKNNLFYIFSDESSSKDRIIAKKLYRKIDFLNYKSISQVKLAQKNALLKLFKKNKIPFREIKIKKIDESVLGELFSYYILETVIVGSLININPYNQPAVEQVKIYTKQFLR